MKPLYSKDRVGMESRPGMNQSRGELLPGDITVNGDGDDDEMFPQGC